MNRLSLVLLYFFRDLAPYLPKSQLCAHCCCLRSQLLMEMFVRAYKFFANSFFTTVPRGAKNLGINIVQRCFNPSSEPWASAPEKNTLIAFNTDRRPRQSRKSHVDVQSFLVRRHVSKEDCKKRATINIAVKWAAAQRGTQIELDPPCSVLAFPF